MPRIGFTPIRGMDMREKHTSTNAADRGEPYPRHEYARKNTSTNAADRVHPYLVLQRLRLIVG